MTHASEFNPGLLDFLARSPTPFHATANLATLLAAAGFEPLAETADWALKPGGRYYSIRNDSSLIAFVMGTEALSRHGIRMLGAHTDSPCLMVRPNPEKTRRGYFQLGVEVYGGALLNPWFDRDLSLAGRVVVRDSASGRLRSRLVDFRRPLAVIPSLAIHLDREVNRNRSINAETDIQPLLGQLVGESTGDLRLMLAEELAANGAAAGEVLDFELCLYDTQAPTQIGLSGEFIAAAREVPEVIGIETFLGRVDVRLNVIARDMGHWTGIYRDRILVLPHIAEVEALMLVATIKDTGGLPL